MAVQRIKRADCIDYPAGQGWRSEVARPFAGASRAEDSRCSRDRGGRFRFYRRERRTADGVESNGRLYRSALV